MPLSGLEGYITIIQHIYSQGNFNQSQAVLHHSSYAVYFGILIIISII